MLSNGHFVEQLWCHLLWIDAKDHSVLNFSFFSHQVIPKIFTPPCGSFRTTGLKYEYLSGSLHNDGSGVSE